MTSNAKSGARLSFQVAPSLKGIIEKAAAVKGQSVGDFAVSALVQAARQVIEQCNVTELSNRDRDRFIALLDDATKKPNKALRDAAARYRKWRL